LCELDRLLAVAERAQGLVAKMDRRSRLPDTVDAVLLALLEAGLVREVTGKWKFRAFAVQARRTSRRSNLGRSILVSRLLGSGGIIVWRTGRAVP
jgi:hypothetical protein